MDLACSRLDCKTRIYVLHCIKCSDLVDDHLPFSETGAQILDTSTSVKIDPFFLTELAAMPLKGASANEGTMNTVAQAISKVLVDLSPLASQPIIGPGATALMNALNHAETVLQFSLECYGTGLKVIGDGLKNTAQGFSDTDTNLTTLFNNLDSELPNFEDYGIATSITFPKATTAEDNTLKRTTQNTLATQLLPQTTTPAPTPTSTPTPSHSQHPPQTPIHLSRDNYN